MILQKTAATRCHRVSNYNFYVKCAARFRRIDLLSVTYFTINIFFVTLLSGYESQYVTLTRKELFEKMEEQTTLNFDKKCDFIKEFILNITQLKLTHSKELRTVLLQLISVFKTR